MYLYRILSIQSSLPADHVKHLAYANFVIEQATADDALWQPIIMTDEAYISLPSAVNSQNYRYYSEETPRIHEETLHDQKMTVWSGVSVEKVIGPYFFSMPSGQAVLY